MADIATAVNGLSMQFDPTPFLTEWQSYQARMNPALSPQQAPFKPPAELSWYDTFNAVQPGAPQQPPGAPPAAGGSFGPQQIAAMLSLMQQPQQRRPFAPGVAPRGPTQVQLSPLTSQQQRTPLIPSFAQMLGR